MKSVFECFFPKNSCFLLQVFSPFSVAASLSKLILGAAGSTREKLEAGMYLPQHFDFKSYVLESTALLQRSNVTLSLANGVFATQRLHNTSRFEAKLQETFQSELINITVKNREESADRINRYGFSALKCETKLILKCL